MRGRSYIALLVWIACLPAYSQVSLTNRGVRIMVEKDAQLFFPGAYTQTAANSASPEGRIFLNGLLVSQGNLIDNSAGGIFNEGSTGMLRLTGSLSQKIEVGSGSVLVPGLELKKPAGSVSATSDIRLKDQLIFNGTVPLTMTDRKLTLLNFSSRLSGENPDSFIDGVNARVVSRQDYFITSNLPLTSILGLGISLGTQGGPAFDPLTILRRRGAQAGVGKRGSISRLFELTSGIEAEMPDLTIDFLQGEVPAGFDETVFELYRSTDRGANWIPIPSSYDEGINRFEAKDVPLAAGMNILAIAERCDPRTPAIKSSIAPISGLVNLCGDTSTVLSYEGNAVYYSWSHTEDAKVIAENSSVTIDSEGTYRLFVRTARGCEYTNLITVRQRALPQASIDFNPDPASHLVCEGAVLSATSVSTTEEGELTTLRWDINGNFFTGADSESFTANATGEFSVGLQVTNSFACTSDFTYREFTVLPQPKASFTVAQSRLCQEAVLEVTNTSAFSFNQTSYPLRYSWAFQEKSSTATAPQFFAESTGAYLLTLEAIPVDQSLNCTANSQRTINVLPKPVASFETLLDNEPASRLCQGQYLDLKNLSAIADHSPLTSTWKLGDGMISVDDSPRHQYVTASQKKIELIVTSVDHGCSDTTTSDIIVHPVPTGSFFTDRMSICTSDSVELQNASIPFEDLEYRWDYGDGSNSESEAFTQYKTFDQAGDYEIELTRTTADGCSNTISRTVRVFDVPEVSFSVPPELCQQGEAVLQNSSTIGRGSISGLRWYVDGVLFSRSDFLELDLSNEGSKQVSLQVQSAEGCQGTLTEELLIKPRPKIDPGPGLLSCGGPLTFDPVDDYPDLAGTTFIWKYRDSIISTRPQVELQEEGLYQVFMSKDGCNSELTFPVKLVQPFIFQDTIRTCKSVELSLPDSYLQSSTRWYLEDEEMATGNFFQPAATGSYRYESAHSLGTRTCTTAGEIYVVIDTPNASIPQSHFEICSGETLPVTDIAGEVSIDWIMGFDRDTIFRTSLYQLSEPGTYQIGQQNRSCITVDTIELIVRNSPQVSFYTEHKNLCIGDTIRAKNLSYNFSTQDSLSGYKWFLDGRPVSDSIDLSYPAGKPGDIKLELIAENYTGCRGTYTEIIRVDSLSRPELDIPASVCEGDTVSIFATQVNSGIARWTINSDVSNARQESIDIVAVDPGPMPVALEVTLGACQQTVQDVIDVFSLPDINLQDSLFTCREELTIQLPDSNMYQWKNLETGEIVPGRSSFVSTENALYRVHAISPKGCESSDDFFVQTGGGLVVDLGKDTAVCESVFLDGGFVSSGTYQWSTGDTTRVIEVSRSGTYHVQIRESEGCYASDTVDIKVASVPEIDFPSAISLCPGEQLTDEIGREQVVWEPPLPSGSVDSVFATTYQWYTQNEHCGLTGELFLEVKERPEPVISSFPHCSGTPVLISQETINPSFDHLWSLDGIALSTTGSFEYSFERPGTYTLSLEVKDRANGCRNQIIKELEIKRTPSAAFRAEPGCPGEALKAIPEEGEDSLLNFRWFLDGTLISSDRLLERRFDFVDNSALTLVVGGMSGCAAREKVLVSPLAAIELNLSHQVEPCANEVVLRVPDDAQDVLWSTNETADSLLVTSTGQFAVRVTSRDGCQTIDSVEVFLNRFVDFSFQQKYSSCGPVTLGHDIPEVATLWSTGERTDSITVKESKEVFVQLTDDRLCRFEDTIDILVHPVPVINQESYIRACETDTVYLNVEDPLAKQYLWADGYPDQGRRKIDKSGYYPVKLRSRHGCEAEEVFEVLIDPSPQNLLPAVQENCGPLFINLAETDHLFRWNTGELSPQKWIYESGNYWVEIINEFSCSITDSTSVTIYDLPDFEVGKDTVLCAEDRAEYRIEGDWADIRWYDGDVSARKIISYPVDAWVEVSDPNGCRARDLFSVDFYRPLDLQLPPRVYICNSEGVQLSVPERVSETQWYRADDLVSTDREVILNSAGTITFRGKDDRSCVADGLVEVIQSPDTILANFLFSSVANMGDVVSFSLLTLPEPDSVSWDFGNGAFSSLSNPEYRYLDTGTYKVELFVSNEYCTDTISKNIVITTEELLDDASIYGMDIIQAARFYPSPASDVLNVDVITQKPTRAAMFLIDMQGTVLQEKNMLVNDDRFSFDVSGLEPGVFFVAVQTASDLVIRRFIKE